MKTVSEGRHAVSRKIVTSGDSLITMAASAGQNGNARGIDRGLRIPGRQNGVLPVTVRAHRSIGRALRNGFAMNGFVIYVFNFAVTSAAGCGNVPVVGPGTGIASGKDGVTGMTIRTGWRVLIARRQSAAVDAEPVSFHRMSEGNFIPGEKLRIGVASRASPWQILLRHGRA